MEKEIVGILFLVVKKNCQYNIMVSNKEIAFEQEINTPVYNTINTDDIIFDSPDLITIAKKHGLSANDISNWATGFHFTLQYMLENDETYLAFTVYGLSPNKKFSYITIDPKTGKVINFMEQSGYNESGQSIWNDLKK